MAQARARRSTRTARPRQRPKTPARSTRQRRAKHTRAAYHDAEIVGLGLAAVGVFFAATLWLGLNGGPVPSAAATIGGWGAYLLPLVLVPIGLMIVSRSQLVAVG